MLEIKYKSLVEVKYIQSSLSKMANELSFFYQDETTLQGGP